MPRQARSFTDFGRSLEAAELGLAFVVDRKDEVGQIEEGLPILQLTDEASRHGRLLLHDHLVDILGGKHPLAPLVGRQAEDDIGIVLRNEIAGEDFPVGGYHGDRLIACTNGFRRVKDRLDQVGLRGVAAGLGKMRAELVAEVGGMTGGAGRLFIEASSAESVGEFGLW